MLAIQKPSGIVEGWHGDGNFARTAIMYAIWKQQGVTVTNWRSDVRLGAVAANNKLYLHLDAQQPWKGRLKFDQPRHRENLHLRIEYPRINQFPEWFTVEADQHYRVQITGREAQLYTGTELIQGIEIACDQDSPQTLIVAEQSKP